MKKLLLVLLISTNIFGQGRYNTDQNQIIKIGTNPKIAITGAYDYSTCGNFAINASWVTEFANKNEGGISIEYIGLNPFYYTFGFIYNHNINILNNTDFDTKIGVEALGLIRGRAYTNSETTFITGGINATLSYNIHPFILSLRTNYKYRPDTISIWNGQHFSWGSFIEIGYKFK